jgi:hypothetical protein
MGMLWVCARPPSPADYCTVAPVLVHWRDGRSASLAHCSGRRSAPLTMRSPISIICPPHTGGENQLRSKRVYDQPKCEHTWRSLRRSPMLRATARRSSVKSWGVSIVRPRHISPSISPSKQVRRQRYSIWSATRISSPPPIWARWCLAHRLRYSCLTQHWLATALRRAAQFRRMRHRSYHHRHSHGRATTLQS